MVPGEGGKVGAHGVLLELEPLLLRQDRRLRLRGKLRLRLRLRLRLWFAFGLRV